MADKFIISNARIISPGVDKYGSVLVEGDKISRVILDFSVYDAIRAGFDKVVFVIKEEMLADFEETVGKRVSGKIKVDSKEPLLHLSLHPHPKYVRNEWYV